MPAWISSCRGIPGRWWYGEVPDEQRTYLPCQTDTLPCSLPPVPAINLYVRWPLICALHHEFNVRLRTKEMSNRTL
jgi:hypothetical protein